MREKGLGASAGHRRAGRGVLVVVAAVLVLVLGGVGVALRRTGGGVRTAEAPTTETEVAAAVSTEQLRNMETAIASLNRQSQALAAMVAAQSRVDRSEASGSPSPPEKPKETRSPAEVRREIISGLDAALVADGGNGADRRARADTVRHQLAEAARGKAQLTAVQCAATFCKATLEEDTSQAEPLDMNVLLEAPAMKSEAMFDYEKTGTRKRTLVYVANAGQPLPFPGRSVTDRSESCHCPRLSLEGVEIGFAQESA